MLVARAPDHELERGPVDDAHRREPRRGDVAAVVLRYRDAAGARAVVVVAAVEERRERRAVEPRGAVRVGDAREVEHGREDVDERRRRAHDL